MKINESTLITYATSSACPTDKEGWLWKRGEVNKNFQKRYFVLKGNLLFYFEKRFDKEPIGVIILEGCTIELAEEEQEMCAFKIAFHGEGRRTYYLGTDSHDSQDIVEDWMKFLASASYDYMKLMVMELQQKLAELEELEKLQELQDLQELQQKCKETNQQQQHSRPNPFNKSEKSCSSVSKTVSCWAQIHSKYGARITSDRDKWCLTLLQN